MAANSARLLTIDIQTVPAAGRVRPRLPTPTATPITASARPLRRRQRPHPPRRLHLTARRNTVSGGALRRIWRRRSSGRPEATRTSESHPHLEYRTVYPQAGPTALDKIKNFQAPIPSDTLIPPTRLHPWWVKPRRTQRRAGRRRILPRQGPSVAVQDGDYLEDMAARITQVIASHAWDFIQKGRKGRLRKNQTRCRGANEPSRCGRRCVGQGPARCSASWSEDPGVPRFPIRNRPRGRSLALERAARLLG